MRIEAEKTGNEQIGAIKSAQTAAQRSAQAAADTASTMKDLCGHRKSLSNDPTHSL
jgi:hypothetical protein